jgi:hypothetical protein
VNDVSPTTGKAPAASDWLGTLVAAGLAAVALAIYMPGFFLRGGSHIAPDPYDPLLNLYIIDWVSRTTWSGVHAAMQLPMYFPSPDALIFSEHYLGLGALLGLLRPAFDAVGAGPAAIYSGLYVASFVTSAASFFWVARRLGLGRAAAFAGSFAFAFSHPRWDQSSHLQMIWAPALPLVPWTFYRLLAAPAWRSAASFLGAFALLLLGGAYSVYMMVVVLAGMAIDRLARSSPRATILAGWRPVLVAALGSGALFAAYFAPYLLGHREPHMQRGVVETQEYSATLLSFVQPTQWMRYERLFPGAVRRNENSLFLGFAVTATLVAAGIGALRRRRTSTPADRTESEPGSWPMKWFVRGRDWVRREPRRALGWALALAGLGLSEGTTWLVFFGYRQRLPALTSLQFIALVFVTTGLVLALWRGRGSTSEAEPVLGASDAWRSFLVAGAVATAFCFPFVFIPMRDVLPGLAGMRVPARFALLASIPWVLLAASLWDRWDRRTLPRTRRRWLLRGGFALLLFLELFPRPFEFTQLDDLARLPAPYRVVESDPNVRALVELPLTGRQEDEVSYLWFQIRHRKPIFNGYSGYEPLEHMTMRDAMKAAPRRKMPNAAEIDRLRELGVTHAMIRKGAFSGRRDRRTFDAHLASGRLRPVTPPGSPRLYALEAPKPPQPRPDRPPTAVELEAREKRGVS